MNANTSLINVYHASTEFQDAACGRDGYFLESPKSICLLLLDFFQCILKDILIKPSEKRILDSPPPPTPPVTQREKQIKGW